MVANCKEDFFPENNFMRKFISVEKPNNSDRYKNAQGYILNARP